MLSVFVASPVSRLAAAVRNSTSIRYVIQGGLVYGGPSKTCVWPTRKEPQPWPWQSEEDRRHVAAAQAPLFPPQEGSTLVARSPTRRAETW